MLFSSLFRFRFILYQYNALTFRVHLLMSWLFYLTEVFTWEEPIYRFIRGWLINFILRKDHYHELKKSANCFTHYKLLTLNSHLNLFLTLFSCLIQYNFLSLKRFSLVPVVDQDLINRIGVYESAVVKLENKVSLTEWNNWIV